MREEGDEGDREGRRDGRRERRRKQKRMMLVEVRMSFMNK